MKKCISFSLFGNKPIYNVGAIKNVEVLQFIDIYKDFDVVVYYSEDTDNTIINELRLMNVKLVKGNPNINPFFWRFLAYQDYDICVFRDCDSRISDREYQAVLQWLNSDKDIHVMRDHPAHKIPYGYTKLGILAGMWGIRKCEIDLVKEIEDFHKNITNKYGCDQTFLGGFYERYIDKTFIHDNFNSGFNKFPTKRVNYHFIGERFDEFNRRFNDYLSLKRYED